MSTAKALEIWTAQSLCDVGIVLSVVSFALHLARPYFDRVRSRLTLRMAADLWWVAYLVMRDGSLFLAALGGLVTLNLDLMADIKIGLPFVPLGTVALVAALVLRVVRDTDGPRHWSRWATPGFASLGALLNVAGYVLVMEGPGDEYATTGLAGLRSLASWRSNANPSLAATTFAVAVSLLAALALIAAWPALGGRAVPRRGGS